MFKHIFTFTLILTSFLFASGAFADPPSRVGRLSYIQGPVSFSPAGSKNTWITARINRPLVVGDRIWADAHARVELQFGAASLQLADKTSLRILNLNDHIAQFDLAQGSLVLHVRSLKIGQIYEVDTPHLAFRITQTGDYRIDVDAKGTIVKVQNGKGIAYAKKAAYKISRAQSYRFAANNFKTPQFVVVRTQDSFDHWSFERERFAMQSRSLQYVSTTMIGYEDLDTYGSWHYVDGYGYAWTPHHVPSGWAPYRCGHWSWINPWGWTWIDDEPWGFAPSHYGRWAYHHRTWIWIPGPRTVQTTYAPAVVAFVGSSHSHVGVTWVPLGPEEVYVPPYKVSKQYFTNINVSNTTINHVKVVNVYNHPTQTVYVNHQAPNAITTVPVKVFTDAQPTAKAVVPMTDLKVVNTPVTPVAPPAEPDKKVVPGDTTTTKPAESTMDLVPVVVAPPAANTPVEKVTPPAEGKIPDAKPEADKVVADKTEAEKKADAEKVAAEKTEAEKVAAEKAEAEKVVAEKAEAEKAAAKQAEADKVAAEKVEAEKAAAKQAEADKVAAEKVEAEKTAAKQAEADKVAAEKVEAEKAAAKQAEADKVAAEKAQAENAEAQNAEAKKAEAERAAAEQAQAEKADAQRAAAEQAQAEKAESQRAAAEQAQAERAEAQRAAAEQAQAERAEAQRAAAEQAQAERAEAQRAAAEQAQAERAEAQRAAAEQAQAERAEAQRAAAERAQAERAEAQRAAAEQAQAERAAAEQRAAAERAQAERAAAEQRAAAERAQAEQAAAAQAAAQAAAAAPAPEQPAA
jgi:hypothetical protein